MQKILGNLVKNNDNNKEPLALVFVENSPLIRLPSWYLHVISQPSISNNLALGLHFCCVYSSFFNIADYLLLSRLGERHLAVT